MLKMKARMMVSYQNKFISIFKWDCLTTTLPVQVIDKQKNQTLKSDFVFD